MRFFEVFTLFVGKRLFSLEPFRSGSFEIA